MQPQVLINNVDVTAYVKMADSGALKVSQKIGGAPENYDTAEFVLDTASMPGATLTSISPLQWQEVVINNSSLSYVVDTFTRPDSSTLGTSDSGHTWVTSDGTTGISSNAALAASGQSFTSSYIDSGQSDVIVKATKTRVGGGITARWDSAHNTGYSLRMSNTNHMTFEKVTWDGTSRVSTVIYFDNTILSTGAVKTLELRAIGSTISAFVDGVQFGPTFTDIFQQTATKHGILSDMNLITHKWDDFYINPLNNNCIFGGFINRATKARLNGNSLGYACSANDWAVLLSKSAPTNDSFTDKTDAYIVQTLLSTYFPNYFVNSKIDSTGTVFSFSTYGETVQEAIRRLCETRATRFKIDPNKNVYYFGDNIGFAPFSFDESGSQSNSASTRTMEMVSYDEDYSGLVTKATVSATDSVSGYTETISGVNASNQYQLAYGTPTVSSYGIQNLDSTGTKPLFWALTDTANPKNTPLVHKTGSYSTTIGGSPATIYNCAWIRVDSALSLPTVYFDPGPKYIMLQIADGIGADSFQVLPYLFQPDYQYNIYYDSGYGTFSWFITSISAPTGGKACVLYVVAGNLTGFLNTPRALWVADGYQAVIDPDTGLITYAAAGGYSNWPITSPQPSGSYPHTITYDGSNIYKGIATYNAGRDLYGPIVNGNHMYFNRYVKDDKVKSAADAEQKALSLLANQADGIITGQLKTLYGEGLLPGHLVTVNSPLFGISNARYLVNQIELNWIATDEVMYTVNFGDYSPTQEDLIAKILRAQNDSQESADVGHVVTATQDYAGFAVSYYDDANAKYDDANTLYS